MTIHGTGIGLRTPHVAELIRQPDTVPWIELLADNHLAPGGAIAEQVRALAGRVPIALHSVGLNLAGSDPLDLDAVARLRDLRERSEALWVSDHLCFTAHAGRHYHDLLPIPYSEEALACVRERVLRIQDAFDAPLVVENVSAYLRFAESTMSEAEFLGELVRSTGCEVLLDVNNLYVNERNHGESALAFLDALPFGAVREVHVAGHRSEGDFLLDTHDAQVCDGVWELLGVALRRAPELPVLVEWDAQIPPLPRLLEEAERAEAVRASARPRRAARAS